MDDHGDLGALECECPSGQCVCPGHGTLVHVFVAHGLGEPPLPQRHEGGGTGAEIGAYTRIACASCGDYLWIATDDPVALRQYLADVSLVDAIAQRVFGAIAAASPAVALAMVLADETPDHWPIPLPALAIGLDSSDEAVRLTALRLLPRAASGTDDNVSSTPWSPTAAGCPPIRRGRR